MQSLFRPWTKKQPVMNNDPVISLIIPCNNEENNLRPLVAAIQRAVEPLDLAYEIIISCQLSLKLRATLSPRLP